MSIIKIIKSQATLVNATGKEMTNVGGVELDSEQQQQPSAIIANNPRLSTQYSSDRVVVKLNNHYNETSSSSTSSSSSSSGSSTGSVAVGNNNNNNNPIKPKYQRNEFKSIFSLLSSKPKISSRMNRYHFDPTSTNGEASGHRTSCPVGSTTVPATPGVVISCLDNDDRSPPTPPHMPLGRSVSCDFVSTLAAAANNNNKNNASVSLSPANDHNNNNNYSIPVIDYTNDEYVITRL